MELTTAGLIMVGLLIVMLVASMPIAFSLIVSGVVGILLTRSWQSAEFLLATHAYAATSNLAYITLPLFLFMGYMAFTAGIAGRAFEAARAWLGGIPGGLPIATVFGCAGFACVSGSSLATAATMAQVSIPEMLKQGYSQRIAAGCVAAGGTLGVLIPPSGILIVYSIMTEVPITDLFKAAFVPGAITTVAYAALLYGWVKAGQRRMNITPPPSASWTERWRTLRKSWEIVVIFLIVMGTIYAGIGTATEAAAFGAGVALVMLLYRRPDRWKQLWKGLVETGVSTSSIFALIIGSSLFGLALSTSQIPQELATWVSSFKLPIWALTVILMSPYLVLGCLVDGLSMMLVTLPVVFPIVKAAGIEPVLFGILIVKTVEIGAIHPPMGLNVFAIKNVCPEIDVKQAFLGSMPFVAVDMALMGLLIAFPSIVTFVL